MLSLVQAQDHDHHFRRAVGEVQGQDMLDHVQVRIPQGVSDLFGV